MFTESSKPTMAKKARPAAAVTAPNRPWPCGACNCVTCEKSPPPPPSAHRPIKMINRSPDSSTQVSTTLALTLPDAAEVHNRDQGDERERDQRDLDAVAEIEVEGLAQVRRERLDAVDAEVMPEHITVNATMNVRK